MLQLYGGQVILVLFSLAMFGLTVSHLRSIARRSAVPLGQYPWIVALFLVGIFGPAVLFFKTVKDFLSS